MRINRICVLLYGSMPSNYQMTTTMCRGVQDGAWRSLNVVNEVLYYQSRTDIVRYDGMKIS